MGVHGPRKKLSAIQRLEGNPGKRLVEDFGVEGLGEPFVAEHLCDDARGCVEIIKRSMPTKVYSALDSFLLAAFAMAWAIHKRAAHEISNPEFKFFDVTETGFPVQSVWLPILNKQAQLMASLGDRLGLDPKSRAALKLPKIGRQASKFDGLIGRTRSSLSANA